MPPSVWREGVSRAFADFILARAKYSWKSGHEGLPDCLRISGYQRGGNLNAWDVDRRIRLVLVSKLMFKLGDVRCCLMFSGHLSN